jgi:hypothetical protein
MKRLSLIFFVSFVLNLLWEHAHAGLYSSYKGGSITNFILFHASLGDAVLITALAGLYLYTSFFKKHIWFMALLALLLATLIEWYGLWSGRWVYRDVMPIVPLLQVGLTPFLQLMITGYVTKWLVGKMESYKQA